MNRLVEKLRLIAERIVLFALRNWGKRFSAAVARHIERLDSQHAKHRQESIEVSGLFINAIKNLEARVIALEQSRTEPVQDFPPIYPDEPAVDRA